MSTATTTSSSTRTPTTPSEESFVRYQAALPYARQVRVGYRVTADSSSWRFSRKKGHVLPRLFIITSATSISQFMRPRNSRQGCAKKNFLAPESKSSHRPDGRGRERLFSTARGVPRLDHNLHHLSDYDPHMKLEESQGVRDSLAGS